jgi:splicing factor 3B subunit 3
MAATSSMFMYSMTLQPTTAIQQAIAAQFLGIKEQQLLTATGSRLTLYRPDARNSVIVPFMSHDVFGIIRSMAAFRVAGGSKGMFSNEYSMSDNIVIFPSIPSSARVTDDDYPGVSARRCLVLRT